MKINTIAQIIGFMGTALYFLSYQCRQNKTLFRIQFLSYLFYTAHLFMLGAFTGGLSYIVNMIRSLCLSGKSDFPKSRTACVILCIMQTAVMFFTWSGPLSVLPVAANIASTIGGYTFNAKKIRVAGIFINSPLWIIYDIAVGSWAGILDEAVSELSMVISVLRYGWKSLDRTEK